MTRIRATAEGYRRRYGVTSAHAEEDQGRTRAGHAQGRAGQRSGSSGSRGGSRARRRAGATPRRSPGVPQQPRWVPVLILTFFGLGLICIVLNYLGLLPGGASNVYLFVGPGLHRGRLHRRHPLALTPSRPRMTK